MATQKHDYALITPVHNEEELIGKVIESVLAQTVLPKRWVIVNDRSTDQSRSIIENYCASRSFISLVNIEADEIVSYYARRTEVFLHGYKHLANESYNFVGSLDADITLPRDYYENIFSEFEANPRLGIASGIYMDLIDGKPRIVSRADISTPGAIQLFRHECYKQIGGYIPLRYGGDDALADIMARKSGWQTRSFKEYKVLHHRPSGTGTGQNILSARFNQGKTDYGIGSHPLFMAAKTLSRSVKEKPVLIGSLARMFGYIYLYLKRETRQVPAEIVLYLRREQLGRLVGVKERSTK